MPAKKAVKKKAAQKKPLSLQEIVEQAVMKEVPSLVQDIVRDGDTLWDVLDDAIRDAATKAMKGVKLESIIAEKVEAALGKINDNDIKKAVMNRLLRI